MAVALVEVNITFNEQITEARKKAKDCFKRAHERMTERENNLLTRIDQIEAEYKTKTGERDIVVEALHKAKLLNADTLTSNTLSDTRTEVYTSIDKKIAELSADTDTSIEFEWDDLFETDIDQLGRIKLNDQTHTSHSRTFPLHVKPVIPDYNAKELPVAYRCKRSSDQKAPGELNGARSMTVHYNTGNIYITERDNNRVQIFNCNGDYISMFSEKMNEPRGICISRDNVYVSQINGHCLNMYELEGKFIASVGSQGNKETQFNKPHCIAACYRTENIYVCDSKNDRIQVMTGDLKFHSLLGIGLFNNPIDVKVTLDRVLILDGSDPCLFVFTSEHVLVNRLITRGSGKQTNRPRSFDVDRDYNIVMSDYKGHCVYVFNRDGEQIHKFGKSGQAIGEFDHPCGIVIDNIGQVIVVCQKNIACMQFF